MSLITLPLSPSQRLALPRTLARAGVFALPLALLVLLRIPSLFEPAWNADEGVFAAVAHDVRHGDALYGGAWDNKPPLIFLTYAGVQSAFGTGVMPIHAAAAVAAVLTTVAVIALAMRLYSPARATAAGLVCAVLLGTPLLEANLALTEIFMIAAVALAMLLAVEARDMRDADRLARYLLAGLLLGIGANFKQVALFDAAALVLVLCCAERQMKPGLAIAAGFALPHLIALAAFAATGELGGYWYAVVGSLNAYSGSGDPGIAERALRLAPAMVAALYVVRLRGKAAFDTLPVVWLGFALAGALSGPFAFPHYLIQVVPPLALVFAGLRRPAAMSLQALAPWGFAAGTFIAALTVYGSVIAHRTQTHPYWYYDGYAMRLRGTLTEQQLDHRFDGSTAAISDIVAAIERDGGGQTMFAWTEMPWVYAATGMRNPTAYSTGWLGTWVPGAREEILADLESDPPDYLVVSQEAPEFGELQVFAAQRYERVEAQNDWAVFRLR